MTVLSARAGIHDADTIATMVGDLLHDIMAAVNDKVFVFHYDDTVGRAQAWMDHGFAFLTINYRGSTTFGREFQEMIWGDVGHWEMENVAVARHWLVREGIARPDQIFQGSGKLICR